MSVEPTNTVATPVVEFAHRSADFARTISATLNLAEIRCADLVSTVAIRAAGSVRPWTGFARTRSVIGNAWTDDRSYASGIGAVSTEARRCAGNEPRLRGDPLRDGGRPVWVGGELGAEGAIGVVGSAQ